MAHREGTVAGQVHQGFAPARLELRERRDQTPGGTARLRPRLDLATLARALCHWEAWGAFSRPGLLPSNAFDVHVVAKPEIFRVSHDPVVRPLGEPGFDHELRTCPVRTLIGDRARGERARRRFQRTQERGQARQLPLGEPRTGVADVDERAALPDTEQQCAEVRATSAAFREAADHAFLTAQDLDLAPRGAAPPRQVGRVQLLGDEALPASREHLMVERAAVAGAELGESEQRGARVAEDAL